jgi:hypothetical protein
MTLELLTLGTRTCQYSILFELFPLFDLAFLQKIQFLNNYDRHWNQTRHTCSLSNGEPITIRQVTLWFVYPELSALANKMLDGVVFSCQQIGVNTFYKCIEFQVNRFDSYWEILIILKQYPKFLCNMPKQGQITRQLHPAFYLSYSLFDSEFLKKNAISQ